MSSLTAALRGAGEVRLPVCVSSIGAFMVIILSPALIFGIGPLPRLGVGGAGLAVAIYYCAMFEPARARLLYVGHSCEWGHSATS